MSQYASAAHRRKQSAALKAFYATAAGQRIREARRARMARVWELARQVDPAPADVRLFGDDNN